MLGFEHLCHMVTHPSTDEAQCCLSLEIFVNSAKKERKKERKKMKVGSRVPSELRGLINANKFFGNNKYRILLTWMFSLLYFDIANTAKIRCERIIPWVTCI